MRSTFTLKRSKPIGTTLGVHSHIAGYCQRKINWKDLNRTALEDLEKLLPLLRYAEPLSHFTTMNSYAVELSETGRIRGSTDSLTCCYVIATRAILS